MAEAVSLSVILPANREARSLATLIPTLVRTLAELGVSHEILVIDTPDRHDDTDDICRNYAVRHIRRYGGDRYGDAVRSGITEARGSYILFMDADGSHEPAYIGAMWALRRFEIVIGSRYVAGGRTANGPALRAMSRLLCAGFRVAFDVRIKDASTSFRLYDAGVLRRLRLDANDFDILQEILVKALASPYDARAVEIPIAFQRRTAGVSKRDSRSLLAGYVKTFLKLRISKGLGSRKVAR